MMVALGIYVRRWQRTLRRWIRNPRVHAIAQTAAYILSGFFLSAASLGNMAQPLTLGLLCAVSGWPAVLIAAGGMAGYILFWGSAGTQGVLWLCLGLSAAVLLGGRQFLRTMPVLLPALAGVTVAVSGVIFQLLFQETAPILMYFLRIALAVFGTLLFTAIFERRDPVIEWLVCGVGVLALAQVMPVPYLGFGYIAAGVLAVTGAFPAAALAGLALDLAQITPTPMTAVLCLAYMVRLIPGLKKGAVCLAGGVVYVAIMLLCGYFDLQPLPGLLLGGVISYWIPGKAGLSHRRGETGFAQVRLEMASSVLHETQRLLLDVEEYPIDEETIIAKAVERACNGCPFRNKCKNQGQKLPVELLHRPLGNGAGLPTGCRKAGRLLQELRRAQEQLRTIRADRDRREEYRAAVTQQYRFLSEYLQDLSDTLAQRRDPPKQFYQPEMAVCSAAKEGMNGDRCLVFAGVECRYYILLCDGMGTGAEAARDGKIMGNMLKKLLCAGYPPEFALRSVNSLCALLDRAGAATIDLAELRLDTGKATLYKWGAAPSYLMSKGAAIKIGTATPPPGLSVTDCRETVEQLSLRRGEMLVLLSDGAEGEESLLRCLEDAAQPPGELAAKLLACSEGRTDDATVAVVRLNSLPTPT
ncbi:MAG: SpoIIE family protein phosphatase [Oscillospiraceae bacterium]|nr:SpoIIE family protein phosphatase [Oscillospiraceae bacterium]